MQPARARHSAAAALRNLARSPNAARSLQSRTNVTYASHGQRTPASPALLSTVGPSVHSELCAHRTRGFASAVEDIEHGDLVADKRHAHFDKILIANRGEIACRVIRTAQKLGIKTVAVYSEADADSLHVQLADEAYCIGPAASSESYLKVDHIIDVCNRSGVQAVHPGHGFLSENANFAERLADSGLVFIGPPASAIISMGSKSESKNIMSAAGVPCVPGYHGDNQDPEYLLSRAEEIGFPVLIKAIHGGGGKGMRTVESASAFQDALVSAKRESLKSFGNDTVLVEKYIVRPRHIEVQVFADTHGSVVSLWERDCSVQRRNQKIIEEAPAPGLSAELRADLSSKAVAAARAVHYVGAGTVEFIFDNDTQEFYFMEMNTRLQVEHPVTEMVTGLDLVEWQLEVAAGNALPLSQAQIPLVGHAFEARIYAENPRNDFLPDSGSLLHLSTPATTHIFAPPLPARSSSSPVSDEDATRIIPAPSPLPPAVRLEQGFLQGAQIGVFYDPMIAKLVVHARDRAEALRVMRGALEEYHIVGLSTNIEFLRALAGHEAFVDGEVETGFIAKHRETLFPPVEEPSSMVLAQAALFFALSEAPRTTDVTSSSPWTTLASRRFGGDFPERIISLRQEDDTAEPMTVHVRTVAPGLLDMTVHNGSSTEALKDVKARLLSATMLEATINGQKLRSRVVVQSPPPSVPASTAAQTQERLHIWNEGRKTTLVRPASKWLLSLGGDVIDAAKAKGAIKAPMPSLVVDVKVSVGDKVEKGHAVIVLESMKTETVLRAQRAGIVRAVGCAKGDMVEEGKELVDLASEEDAQ